MLIYLNGTSSSGKTAIATELQRLLAVPCLYFSIDTILSSLASEDLEAIMGRRDHRRSLNWDSLFSGYFASVNALVRAGNFVIADCPVYNPKLEAAFAEHIGLISRSFVVKVVCPLTELEMRERARGDRAIGIAKRQFDGIHGYLKYDFEVESDKLTPLEAAQRILAQANPIPKVFEVVPTSTKSIPRINEIISEAKRHWNYSKEYVEQALPLLRVDESYLLENQSFEIQSNKMTIGFVALASKGFEKHLDHLWIDPKFIGNGAGHAACEFVFEYGKKSGWKEIFTYPDPPAEGFYLKQGFTDTGRRIPSRIPGGPTFSIFVKKL